MARIDPLADENEGAPLDDDTRKLLQELNDKKLFPGYDFYSKDKFIPRSASDLQRSILLQNKADLFLTVSLDDEERMVLDKHTINGSISAFKGKEEMKEFKKTLAIKRDMEALRTTIREQEEAVDFTKEKLRILKVRLFRAFGLYKI